MTEQTDLVMVAEYMQEKFDHISEVNRVLMDKLVGMERANTDISLMLDVQAVRIQELEDTMGQLIQMLQELPQ